MSWFENVLKSFHNKQTFKKGGLKQISTWIGIAIFVCVFDDDLLILVHNVLTNSNLAEKISTGLAGAILVWFNKIDNK